MLAHPVVLLHGYVDVPAFLGTWRVVESTLEEMEIKFFAPQLPSHGSLEERTQSAIHQIAKKYPKQKVHLFGHSMGGLNSRDIASRLIKQKDLGFEVVTVTTFGTPHRGVKAIDWVPGVDGKSPLAASLRKIFGSDFLALGNLSHKFMTDFNQKTPDNPKVYYFSWAGETELPTPLFLINFPSVRLFGPCDGLVNTDSAEWGTHLGTLQGVDHIAIVGRSTTIMTMPHLLAAEKGGRAPVLPIDNNLLKSLGRTVEGGVNQLLGIPRGLLGTLGLRF